MRLATLLLGLSLAACAGGTLPGAQPDLAAPSAAASPPTTRMLGSGSGARGGGSTAAARAEPVEARPDPVIQARADCWMMVEHQKGIRGIDQRSDFVDKCVAGQLKDKP
jgi:hypothetical protein